MIYDKLPYKKTYIKKWGKKLISLYPEVKR